MKYYLFDIQQNKHYNLVNMRNNDSLQKYYIYNNIIYTMVTLLLVMRYFLIVLVKYWISCVYKRNRPSLIKAKT